MLRPNSDHQADYPQAQCPTNESRNWAIPLGIAVLASLAWLGGDYVGLPLRYDRNAVLDGQVHRILTAHFLHLGGWHLVVNLLGLGLIWWLVGHNARLREWLLILVGSMFSVSLGLMWFAPDVDWYVGLSGTLHGLLLAGALLGRRTAWLLVLLVAGKLAWEQWLGPASPAWLGGDTIIEAHLYGAFGGALGTLLLRWRGIARRSGRPP